MDDLSGGQRQGAWIALVLAQGTPAEVSTEEVMADTFGINSLIIPDPVTGTPLCIPCPELPNGPALR